MPEVPLSWWGLVSLPLSFPYGKLSVRPDIVIGTSKSYTHKVGNTVRTPITYVFLNFLNIYIITKIFLKVKFLFMYGDGRAILTLRFATLSVNTSSSQ